MPARPLPPSPNPKSRVLFLATAISASSLLVCAFLYLFFYLWYFLVRRARTIPVDSTAPLNLKRFSFRELKSATNDFSDSNLIGKGGSGTVYFGILRDGKSVAVKKLDSSSLQAEREFQNELQVLGSLKSSWVAALLGFCVGRGDRLLVYEYMPNRSLQELLFWEANLGSGLNLSLSWERRFGIIFDVARAVAFLHTECDPPVIHGDIKPSNVLLDSDFRARLSDFGLSRVKVECEFGAELFSPEVGRSQELSENLPAADAEASDEVDFALALQTSSSSRNRTSCLAVNRSHLDFTAGNANASENDTNSGSLAKGTEVWDSNGDGCHKRCDDEICSVEHSGAAVMEDAGGGAKQWGRDWWWKQSGSGELCSRDYVMEWIGSQIGSSGGAVEDDSSQVDRSEGASGLHLPELVPETPPEREKKGRRRKQKTMQDWWEEEEHLAEKIAGGGHRNSPESMRGPRCGFRIPQFGVRQRGKLDICDGGDCSGEFSFRRGWRRRRRQRRRLGGGEMWSGEALSRELSSTTSMRGTLCYVAPEYGGCDGDLMEKADIYSLGVLILVIVSGRRPLHVLPSPMKLEKANLVSWCRQLAQSGNVLELVDGGLGNRYNKEQAGLCVNLALACLQKVPELRPDIGAVVKILKGEMEIPPPSLDFSPSPPSKALSRSRKKQRKAL